MVLPLFLSFFSLFVTFFEFVSLNLSPALGPPPPLLHRQSLRWLRNSAIPHLCSAVAPPSTICSWSLHLFILSILCTSSSSYLVTDLKVVFFFFRKPFKAEVIQGLLSKKNTALSWKKRCFLHSLLITVVFIYYEGTDILSVRAVLL